METNWWDKLFAELSEMKVTDYKEYVHSDKQYNFHKNSAYTGSNLIKNILTNNDPMQLVIIGHLYFDYVFKKLLEHEGVNTKERKYQSFKNKIDKIKKLGLISEDEYLLFIEINKLRNHFSHNVFFNIAKWNPKLIPQVIKYNLSIPKRKDLLVYFITVVIQTSFFAFFLDLSNKNKWLYLEKVPK